MAIEVTRQLREAFMQQAAENMAAASPIVGHGDGMHIRFDAVQFEQQGGEVRATFLWRGDPVFWMSGPFSAGSVFSCHGLDGKVKGMIAGI